MDSKVTVQFLGPEDFRLLETVGPGVFDFAIDPEQARAFLDDPAHQLAVALVAGRIVGMVSAVRVLHPDKQPQVWINELGVHEAHRRQGIGRRLLEAMLDHAREHGCAEAWLATESDNDAARGLYRGAGGAERRVVYVEFPLDARAPGMLK